MHNFNHIFIQNCDYYFLWLLQLLFNCKFKKWIDFFVSYFKYINDNNYFKYFSLIIYVSIYISLSFFIQKSMSLK